MGVQLPTLPHKPDTRIYLAAAWQGFNLGRHLCVDAAFCGKLSYWCLAVYAVARMLHGVGS